MHFFTCSSPCRTHKDQFAVLYLMPIVSVMLRSKYNPRKSKWVTDFHPVETLLCNGHSRERIALLVSYGRVHNKTSDNSRSDNFNSLDYNQHARSLRASSPFGGYRKIPKLSPPYPVMQKPLR